MLVPFVPFVPFAPFIPSRCVVAFSFAFPQHTLHGLVSDEQQPEPPEQPMQQEPNHHTKPRP